MQALLDCLWRGVRTRNYTVSKLALKCCPKSHRGLQGPRLAHNVSTNASLKIQPEEGQHNGFQILEASLAQQVEGGGGKLKKHFSQGLFINRQSFKFVSRNLDVHVSVLCSVSKSHETLPQKQLLLSAMKNGHFTVYLSYFPIFCQKKSYFS